MWTARIRSRELLQGTLHVVCEFTDGTQTLAKEFLLETSQDIRQLAQAEAARLEGLTALAAKIAPGDPLDVTPVVPVTDPTEAARKAYFGLLANYTQAQKDVSAGLIAADDPRVAALAGQLKAAYRPEYSGL